MPAVVVPALQRVVGASSISEAAGPAATTGTVTRLNMSTAEPLTVALRSSDTTEATVPASVVIPAGQASAQFAINAVDDTLRDGTQSLTITAVSMPTGSFALDQGFGSGGRASQAVGMSQAVAVGGDGKVVVAGYYYNMSTERDPYDLVLTRYLANGTPDAGFAGTGRLIADISGESDRISAVAVQPDGKIVVGGTWGYGPKFDFELARFNVDGTFDATFGAGGKVLSDLSDDSYNEVWDLVLQPDGKILAAGNVGPKLTVVRYNPDGTFDTGFGVGGVASTTIGQYGARGFGAALQPDGKIVLTGTADGGNNISKVALVRFGANGVLDATFGSGGKVLADLPGTFDEGRDVALQADGKIVVVGSTETLSGGADFAVLRYLATGAPDLGFDGDGMAITDFGASNDAHGVAIQADGTILVAGHGPTGAIARHGPDGTLLPASSYSGATEGKDVAIGGDGRVFIVAQPSGNSIVEARFRSTDLTAKANLSVTDDEAGASIRGTLWDDLDGDATRDPGEPALAGRTVYLDQDQDRVLDAGERSTTSAADGTYAFTGLATGMTYYVTQVLPTNWRQTAPAASAWRAFALAEPTQQVFDFQELASTTTREIPTYRKNGFTFDTTVQPSTQYPNEFRVPGSSDTS